jgi:hypothetical protein
MVHDHGLTCLSGLSSNTRQSGQRESAEAASPRWSAPTTANGVPTEIAVATNGPGAGYWLIEAGAGAATAGAGTGGLTATTVSTEEAAGGTTPSRRRKASTLALRT